VHGAESGPMDPGAWASPRLKINDTLQKYFPISPTAVLVSVTLSQLLHDKKPSYR